MGNAVCAHVAEWVGKRLVAPGIYEPAQEHDFLKGTWPMAAYGSKGKTIRAVMLSAWPLLGRGPVLSKFLKDPLVPLSHRAAAGFLSRALLSEKMNYAPQFLSSAERYVRQITIRTFDHDCIRGCI